MKKLAGGQSPQILSSRGRRQTDSRGNGLASNLQTASVFPILVSQGA